jgi:PIN domain nuclease of toxin-antitoxin system
MTSVVLDSSAILAVIHDEPGADIVIAALGDAILSVVNYAEIVSKLVERRVTNEMAVLAIQKIAPCVIDYDIHLAARTGFRRAQTIRQGLSLGDRACLALAEREGLPALTADRKWTKLDLGIDIRLIR